MESINTHLKREDVFAPIKTLAQSDSPVLIGTLVWAKDSYWPWWPGLVVKHKDIGWPILKKKDTYCIHWFGPNKTASLMPAHNLSDFLDRNFIRLVNQPMTSDEQEIATCEALRGVMSQQMMNEDELDTIPTQKLKSLANQTWLKKEKFNGRKQVIMKRTSCWFRRMVDSLKSPDKSLTNVSNIKKKETRLPCATNSQKRVIVSPPNSHEKGSPSSSTHSVEMSHPAVDYCERSAKKTEEEERDEPPPRKKKALAIKQTADQGAFNTHRVDGMSLMQKFLQDELFRSLEITRAYDDDILICIY